MVLKAREGHVAIRPPRYLKPEIDISGGIAIVSQKNHVIMVELMMDYADSFNKYSAGDMVILPGNAGLTGWAKKVYELNDGGTKIEFVICPINEILGFALRVPRISTKES